MDPREYRGARASLRRADGPNWPVYQEAVVEHWSSLSFWWSDLMYDVMTHGK